MASLIALYGTEEFPIWVATPLFGDTCPVFWKNEVFEMTCNNPDTYFYICNILPAEIAINSTTQLVFTSANISMSSIIIQWKALAGNSIPSNLTMRTRGGFTLSWRILNSSNIGSMNAMNKSDKWKIKEAAVSLGGFINENNMNMMTIMYLVRQSKKLKVNAKNTIGDGGSTAL